MSHTPGPWTVPYGHHVLTEDARFTVADCSVSDMLAEETKAANARLCAAAPDLLAAARVLDSIADGAIRQTYSRAFWALRAAIAKAESTS